MKVALAQIAPRLGNLQYNLKIHQNTVAKAKKENVDLLIFPELSLTGYTLKDLTQDAAINPQKDTTFKKLRTLSHGISLVF